MEVIFMDQNNELQLPIDLVETITDDKLRNNVTLDLSQRITAPVGDIKEIMDHANTILSSNYRFNNATSFKDISSRLTKEKLNVESKTVTVAATSSVASTEIKPDDEYVGLSSVVVNVKPLQNLEVSQIIPENFNYIPDDSAELETIYLKSTNTTSTAIDITITTDNPTEYSGLNIVKINDIGIIQNQKFTVAKEHLISSNTFKVVFADDKHFGASDVDITVPLVKNKRFTVNKNTIGRTYVPAEGDLALDGTSMTDTVPAIGFESVTLDASIASGVTASTLKSLALSGQGGNKISPSGTALGYESVEIPTLETLESSVVQDALLKGTTALDPANFGYSQVELPTLSAFTVNSTELADFIYSTSTTYKTTENLFKSVELICPTFSKYTVDSSYISSVQTEGATKIKISKSATDISVEGIYLQGIDGSTSTVGSMSIQDPNILNEVVIELPESQPLESSAPPIQILMLNDYDPTLSISTNSEFTTSHRTHMYCADLTTTKEFWIYMHGSGSYYSDTLTISQFDSETDRLLHTATFYYSESNFKNQAITPVKIDFKVSATSVEATATVISNYLRSWSISEEYVQGTTNSYSKSSGSDLSTAINKYKLDSNNKFYLVVTG
jgi:hypothetical protein